jgi:hypothetical protein
MAKFLLTAALAALGCGSAQATIVKVTYTGTVLRGSDGADGAFGGGNLVGDAFTASYMFDTSKGVAYNAGGVGYVDGGNGYGVDSPSLGASLTINGHTASVAGNDYGRLLGQEASDFSEEDATAQSDDYYLDNNVYAYRDAAFGSTTFAPYNADLTGASSYGSFVSYLDGTTLTLAGKHLTVAAGAVPEPTSWALMLGGFGMVGGALRSRRKLAFG